MAIFFHAISLVLGFGCVLAIDMCWVAALLGRRSLTFAAQSAATIDPLLWAGCLGLGVSGLLLMPNLHAPLMWVKLFAALVAVLKAAKARP